MHIRTSAIKNLPPFLSQQCLESMNSSPGEEYHSLQVLEVDQVLVLLAADQRAHRVVDQDLRPLEERDCKRDQRSN